MIKKINLMKNQLNQNNKGATIITVLIVMIFVSILGATLLFVTYAGTLAKVTSRKGNVNFYDAQSALNTIKTAFEDISSRAIADAFSETLVSQTVDAKADRDYDMDKAFEERFIKDIFKQSLNTSGPVFIRGADIYNYTIKTEDIINYLEYVNGGVSIPEIEVHGTGGADKINVELIVPADGGKREIRIKDITVTHTKNNYISEVSTDIIIVPLDTKYSVANYSVSDLPEFSVIAKNEFSLNSGFNISGNVYAKDIVKNDGGKYTFNDGTFIARQSLELLGGGEIEFGPSVTFWSNHIDVENGKLTTDGYVNVKDDLNILDEGKVTIKGNYVGYGDSKTDANESSAILINGKATSLNLEGARRLSLLGQSFVLEDVLTGESISVQSSQKSYLIPTELITITKGEDDIDELQNPSIVDFNKEVIAEIDADRIIFNLNGVDKKLSDYGISKDDVSIVSVPLAGNTKSALYFFMKFDTTKEASAYFSDYFEAKKDEMNIYIDFYINEFQPMPASKIFSEGLGLTKSGTVFDTLDTTASLSGINNDNLTRNFDRLKTTLTNYTDVGDVENTTPYSYYVDETKMAGIAAGIYEFKDAGGNVVAILANNSSYNLAANMGTNAILTVGEAQSVVVDRNFEGIIFSEGNIFGNNNISSAPDKVRQALNAVCEINGKEMKFGELFKLGIVNSETMSADKKWDLDNVVSFDNWVEN